MAFSMRQATASAASLEPGTPEGNAAVLRFRGRLDVYSVATIWDAAVRALDAHPRSPVIIDASAVQYCDGAGIALLIELLRRPRPAGATVIVRGLQERFERLLEQFDPRGFNPLPAAAPVRESITERLGRETAELLDGGYQRLAFVGESSAALADAVAHPLRMRWSDALEIAQRAGADAVPIVMLIGFLMGVILAFQSAIAMHQFGAEIYVANLVALSLLRELGPLMTAILLAGRSGSAFAAEIGTMKVNEEINALITMGLNPVRFLVVPRLLAGVLMCPALTLLADLIGLIGGAVVMRGFGIPLVTYFQQVETAATQGDLFGGIAKAFVFGLLVAGVGCLQGLKTGQGPSAVGLSTTRAVVGGIVLIVAADGLFAVLFHVLNV
jgi:phospholipid/cholesterol/gamma-HCH transport system permease protein